MRDEEAPRREVDLSPAALAARQEIMRRFGQWLDETLASEEEPTGVAAEILADLILDEEEKAARAEKSAAGKTDRDPCDLYSMWSAITAMAQEIKLQGRAFKQLGETLAPIEALGASISTFLEAHGEALAEARESVELPRAEREEREKEIRREAVQNARREVLEALLDMRDRLERGYVSVRLARREAEAPPGRRWAIRWPASLFGNSWKASDEVREIAAALEKGYCLATERLDELLELLGVREIESRGQRFDPRLMNAVDVETDSRLPDGTVAEVYRPGYTWGGEVFRPAQVKVARKGP